MGHKFRWTYNTLTPTMAAFSVTSNIAIREEAKHLAGKIEEYMRQNAPWEDQTGAARAGLKADLSHQGFRQTITIHHSVDYGIFLEVCNDQQYAIIIPTLEHFEGHGFEGMAGLFTRTNFVGKSSSGSVSAGDAPSDGGGEE